jgi:type IV secretion system protein VirB2
LLFFKGLSSTGQMGLKMKRQIEYLGSVLAVFVMLLGQRALAAVPGDPQGSGVLISAVSWLQGTLMGTVATVVAVIAIAAVGFGMLTGRINWRHGAVVVLGCFILFGAASIVGGIRAAATAGQY